MKSVLATYLLHTYISHLCPCVGHMILHDFSHSCFLPGWDDFEMIDWEMKVYIDKSFKKICRYVDYIVKLIAVM